jgi:hypothetical protein
MLLDRQQAQQTQFPQALVLRRALLLLERPA